MARARYKKHRYPGVRYKRPGTYVIDYIDYNGERHQKTFHGTEAEAARVRRQLLAKVDRIKAGLEAVPEPRAALPTLSELWEEFTTNKQLKVQAGSMNARSLARYKDNYNALKAYDPLLVDKRLEWLAVADFEEFKKSRLEAGISPEGVNADLRGLKTLLNFAVKQRYLETSPLADVPYVKFPRPDVRFLDGDELHSLFFTMEAVDQANSFEKDARDLTLFYLYTGARLTEALFPTFDWLCDGQQAIRFSRTKGSKTRTIPKTDSLAEILESRKAVPDGPFPLSHDQAYKRVKWLLGRAGIGDASPHTLRKTAGAWYYMATRDIFATSRFLGHSSVSVTEQHYAGLIESLKVDYARQFEAALNAELQLGCNLETKPDLSRPTAENSKTPISRRETGVPFSSGGGTRTPDTRIMIPLL